MRRAFIILLLALLGCEDSSTGRADAATEPDIFSDGPDTRVVDRGTLDLRFLDAAPEADMGDAAPPCFAGETRCLEQGVASYQQCIEGVWSIQACPEDEICLGNRCEPDPAHCEAGERTCLDEQTPGLCEPGVGFMPDAPCPEGLQCADGQCQSPECIAAGRQRSYLGCEHHAVALPNSAWHEAGGTPTSPLGIVLTNPSDLEALLSVYDPAGALAQLVGTVEVEPTGLFAGTYAPVTVQTEIRDSDNQIVESGFERADGLVIPPGGMAVVLVEHFGPIETTGIRAHAYKFQSTRPLAAYQFAPYCCNFSFTNDASLILPTAALGTDYFYLGVPSWAEEYREDPDNPFPPPDENSGSPATLSIVGAHPNTQVEITLPPGVEIQPDPDGAIQMGPPIQATLQPSEVLTLISRGPQQRPGRLPIGVDLSGARINSTEPVSVFSGHVCTFYPQTQGACDHVEESLFPTDTWGRQFALAPTQLRTVTPELATEATFWKIQALFDDTRVELSVPFAQLDPSAPGFAGVPDCADHLDGAQTIVLGEGEYCEFGTRAGVQLTGDTPIQVLGVISGSGSAGIVPGGHAGDPSIFLAPPESQWRTNYVFLAPTTYFSDYVTIVAQLDTEIHLDGEEISLQGGIRIEGTDRIFKHVLIEDGPHRIGGTRPFGILVYAYDDHVSYAFTGGLNFQKR